MSRVGQFEAVDVQCRNGHTFPTTVRKTGTKCPECTITVYVRKDGTVGYLRGEPTDPTPGRTAPKTSTIPVVKVATSDRKRSPRSVPNSVPPTTDAPAESTPPAATDAGNGKGESDPVQSSGRKRGGGKPARTPYGHVY